MTGYEIITNTTSQDGLKYSVVFKPMNLNLVDEIVRYQRLDIEITSNNSISMSI
jgi:hypothetical protein